MTRQKTIKRPVTVEGIGLQTGIEAKVNLKPSPAGSGINFIRTDLFNKPLLSIQSMNFADSPRAERRTVVGAGPVQIQTTEHLLAALSGLAIDNIIIELDSIELPGIDGSAKGFADAILRAGIVEQDAPRRFLKVDKAIWCAGADNLLAVFPDEELRISYTMSYDNPALGTQFFSIILSEDGFKKDIAPARTFCLEEEAAELLKRGLGKGAGYENTLVIGRSGPINNTLRFPNEPVRHKILDLVGDLYLVGMPIRGHVVAIKSGHALNMELVRKLRSLYSGRRSQGLEHRA